MIARSHITIPRQIKTDSINTAILRKSRTWRVFGTIERVEHNRNQGKRPNIEGGMAIQVEADGGCVRRREDDALVPAKMATTFPRIE